ncbi:ammonium transporter, Amt family [Fistulifera solaris]|uniref:Ammonium transporter n=1 Tax=Fistulifera solaris TaxID=1519565 RepID=A0A1Z5JDA1_FISSO|nr:ammonium transporter, Amt family [Fistulifera solaris]|eukprot:GAX11926.1 ammonium transporter, Amt family [Fistulifera solaris]
MQAGFAMLCAGCIRAKNVKNIMLQNILDICAGSIGFYTVGYGFAYGGADHIGSTFIGNSYFGLRDFNSWASFFFQFAFAATCATIVAGTVAERCKMSAYLCYSIFLTGFVYPVVAHSMWSSNGFLSAFNNDGYFRDVGCIDFAGSGVVHMTGGLTALIAAVILGPRKGRFYDEDGNPWETPVTFQPHSVALQVLGTLILWFGWYGFNSGSALAIANEDSAAVASLSAVTTTLAGASACVSALFTDSILESMATGETSYDLTMAMNGGLGGLVAVTAGTACVTPWAAIIIGIVGGWVYIAWSKLLIALKVDDSVDGIPVHLGNGMWGLIAAGLFAKPELMDLAGYNSANPGLFYSEGGFDGHLLLVQVCCIFWIIGWVSCVTTPFFMLLNAAGMFRVDPLEEEVGLDISSHRGSAYDISGPRKEDVDELMEVRASKHGKIDTTKEVKAVENAAE